MYFIEILNKILPSLPNKLQLAMQNTTSNVTFKLAVLFIKSLCQTWTRETPSLCSIELLHQTSHPAHTYTWTQYPIASLTRRQVFHTLEPPSNNCKTKKQKSNWIFCLFRSTDMKPKNFVFHIIYLMKGSYSEIYNWGADSPLTVGQETTISRHTTTNRQDSRDLGKATQSGDRVSLNNRFLSSYSFFSSKMTSLLDMLLWSNQI